MHEHSDNNKNTSMPNNAVLKQRDHYIDFLRFVGLSLIILAHVHAPDSLHQLRCFDVPLMLFVSGLSYSGKRPEASWKLFFLPRFKRLLIPTYLFVVCDLIALSLLHNNLSLTGIVKSLLLCTDGSVGYVWIIKIFLLITLVTPFLTKLNDKLKTLCFVIIVISIFILQEYLVVFQNQINNEALYSIFSETIPYLFGYSIPFLIGLRIKNCTQNNKLLLFALITISFCTLLFLYINNHNTPIRITPFYKYPPRSYFLIYGVFASTLLFLLNKPLTRIAEIKLFSFIGKNTIWIYLWHIPFVSLLNIMIDEWFIKYLLAYSLSLICFFSQYKIVTIIKNRKNIKILDYFIG